ncbi:MAG TPA: metal ABC transporter permease [Planctomycetaceae bacterium]|nr:metal ABC transporter permease [Planctomycetaceae bacterium]
MPAWLYSFLTEYRIELWTVAVAVVSAAACAILGCFLVLRRMSLMGDAISHSVLAGVAGAYLLTGQLSAGPMLAGAVAVGLLTAALTQTLHRFGRVPEDSSMGVVFTSLFALGVVVVSGVNVHLDTDCVLFGKLEFVAWHTVPAFGTYVPFAVVSLLPAFGLTLAFVLFLWKELKIASFDPLLATAMGVSAGLIHYLLMSMVALVTVASLEAVGAIVVVAMLIVPAAAAHLLTDRLGWMVGLAVVIGVVSAVAGWYLARWLNTSAAGMMAVVAGGQFTAAVFLAPRHGLVSRWVANARLALRIACEDIVGIIYRREERQAAGEDATVRPAASTLADCLAARGDGPIARLAVLLLKRRELLLVAPGGQVALTDRGRRLGRSLVRSHRLWEAYLDQNFDLPADHLHEPAERIEHFIGPELQEQLAEALRSPERDPHGSTIPPSSSEPTAARSG